MCVLKLNDVVRVAQIEAVEMLDDEALLEHEIGRDDHLERDVLPRLVVAAAEGLALPIVTLISKW
jgi:hypothetical protein